MTSPTQADIERARNAIQDFIGCEAIGVHLIECESLIPALALTFAEVRAEAAPKWLPIETAPRDGSWVLLIANQLMRLACWRGWDWHGEADQIWRGMAPTHWQPLPIPPESTP